MIADKCNKKFLSQKAEPRNTNPIEFWFKNKDHYPFVYSVAAKYLACPGSSVASEETFSKTGNIKSKKRNRTSSALVNMTAKLKVNM